MSNAEQNQNPAESLEVLQPSALEAIERAQVDVQVATAHRYPRTIEQFKKRAMTMATIDGETAESCCYTRPVGKKKNAQGHWVQEYAEGASIRLAEIVAASYGNIRVAARIIEQTARYVKCEGVAHDLESNYAGKSESFEPTVTKEGQPYSEGMRAVVAKGALAKAYRDAVFKVVPRALCKPIYEAAKRVAAGTEQTIDRRRLKAKAWLSSIRVDDARLFSALGVKEWNEVLDEHLTILTGLKTAISDKDTTIEEAFPLAPKAPDFGPAQARTTTTPPPKPQEIPQKEPKQPETPEPKPSGVPQDEPEDGGLGPVTPDDQKAPPGQEPAAGDPLTNPVTPQESDAQQQPTDPGPFKPNTAETDELQSVRLLLHQAGLTEARLMDFCRAKKMSRDGQKLSELSTAKLKTLISSWPNILPEIKT
jgi:hypothetical protein